MTLIVNSLTSEYAVQVSDRRLTFADGSVSDDESNKLFIFSSEFCRFAVSFAGFAGFTDKRHFQTRMWLAEALRDCGPPDFIPAKMIERLSNAATAKLRETVFASVDAATRRLTIVLTGFLSHPTLSGIPVWAAVTNYQDYDSGLDSDAAWPEFRYWHFEPVVALDKIASVQRFGFWKVFNQDRIQPITELLQDKKPPKAIVGKTVEMIREAASDPASLGLIGRQLMSAIVSPDPSIAAQFAYHSDVESFTMYSPTIVSSYKSQGGAIISDAQLTALGPNAFPIFPKKQPRNAKCSCGSGLKYKRCHGKVF